MGDLGAGCWEMGWGGGGLAAALLCPGCGLTWCLCTLSPVCLLNTGGLIAPALWLAGGVRCPLLGAGAAG